MPFQAIAWAWKVDLADPVERCVLLWCAGQSGPHDFIVDLDLDALERFSGVDTDGLRRALLALQSKGLIRADLDFAGCVRVVVPVLPLEQAGDEFFIADNRDPLPASTKALVVKAAGGLCFACGSAAEPQVDHILPRRWGGTNDISNLQVLCGDCNRRKRDRQGWVAA